MNEKEDVNINLFDLKFLIQKASNYVRDWKNEHNSMKLWEDRIKEIKSKCNYDELIRGKNNESYAHESYAHYGFLRATTYFSYFLDS